jgi:hypothetical protein
MDYRRSRPMSDSNDVAVKRSGFVTGLAWTFIALAGQGTLMAVLQNVMFTLMFVGIMALGVMWV